MPVALYTDGVYLDLNPTWHAENSPWKAGQVTQMLARHTIVPRTVCEIGCGSGEILRQLQASMSDECVFWGYDISPQALELCKARANDRLHFTLGEVAGEHVFFDLVLLIDVIEHVEDCFSFLREVRTKGKYKMFHIPLDLSMQSVLRTRRLMGARSKVGHLHYFTKDLALQTLRDTGYEILDYFYTASDIDLAPKSAKGYLARLPRKLAFALHKDLAVRIMGGYSLMVLAQ